MGLLLSCQEVLETASAVADRVVWPDSLIELKSAVSQMAVNDLGIADATQLSALQTALTSDTVPGSHGHYLLTQLLADVRGHYVSRWVSALHAGSKPSVEVAARSLAAYLLDAGFSLRYLQSWFARLSQEKPSAADLWDEAAILMSRPCPPRRVLVALAAPPSHPKVMPPEWLEPNVVSEWLVKHRFPRERQGGGFLFTIDDARDEVSAVERSAELIDALAARLMLGSKRRLDALPRVWVEGYGKPLQLKQHSGVTVDAIVNTQTTYVIEPNSRVDSALQLASELGYGSPATTVATAWAALETLLIGPGDGDRGVAADRCADLVMCSLPRAEATSLAHAHLRITGAGDPITAELAAAGSSNRAKAAVVEDVIRRKGTLNLSDAADQVAQRRLIALVHQPTAAFPASRHHVLTALRRLFRQRNIVLHAGHFEAAALRPGLRVAAPLVAEGMNMIAYRWLRANPLDSRVDPLALAARARLRLELVGSSASAPLHDLLRQ